MSHIDEPARQTPVADCVDVLVCGGGPAGVCAAIAAARAGARTALIEVHGCLGGIWTAGLLSYMLDVANKQGLMHEILQRVAAAGGRAAGVGDGGGAATCDVEKVKWVLEQMCREAGVKLRYHSRVVSALVGPDRRLRAVVTESKSGRQAWEARTFIDCTGDGDLAAQAGCQFALGRPAEQSDDPSRAGETQPFSLIALVAGAQPQDIAEFHDRADGRGWAAPKDALMAEFRKFGAESSYAKPSIFHVRDDLFIWMVNHEYGYSAMDAEDVTDATVSARAELNRLIDGLRGLGGIWSHLHMVATAEQIGTREGRRIAGRYEVTLDDMLTGQRHDDAICRATFNIDIHSTNPRYGKSIEALARKKRSQPYDIPLGALIARDVAGLMMAGRCISGDFFAHSSYRVTGNAAAMGQAAGVCAALAATSDRLPGEVPFEQIRLFLPQTPM